MLQGDIGLVDLTFCTALVGMECGVTTQAGEWAGDSCFFPAWKVLRLSFGSGTFSVEVAYLIPELRGTGVCVCSIFAEQLRIHEATLGLLGHNAIFWQMA
jgi:hypothetical protein